MEEREEQELRQRRLMDEKKEERPAFKINKFLRNKLKKVTDNAERERIIEEYKASKEIKVEKSIKSTDYVG